MSYQHQLASICILYSCFQLQFLILMGMWVTKEYIFIFWIRGSVLSKQRRQRRMHGVGSVLCTSTESTEVQKQQLKTIFCSSHIFHIFFVTLSFYQLALQLSLSQNIHGNKYPRASDRTNPAIMPEKSMYEKFELKRIFSQGFVNSVGYKRNNYHLSLIHI